jgi:hypothetical protein
MLSRLVPSVSAPIEWLVGWRFININSNNNISSSSNNNNNNSFILSTSVFGLRHFTQDMVCPSEATR